MSTFERPSAYGDCTLKPVVGVALFWPIGLLEVADNRKSTDAFERPIGEPKLPSTHEGRL
jgi:hypothetical protein